MLSGSSLSIPQCINTSKKIFQKEILNQNFANACGLLDHDWIHACIYFTFPKLIFLKNICTLNSTKLRVLVKEVADVQKMKFKPYTRGKLGLINIPGVYLWTFTSCWNGWRIYYIDCPKKYIKITQNLETTDQWLVLGITEIVDARFQGQSLATHR